MFSTPTIGDTSRKQHIGLGIQIQALLTPNPILGNVSLAQKNIKHLEKKRDLTASWQRVLFHPVGTHPIYCDVLVRLSLNSVPYTCINTWIFLCTEVYPLTNSLIVLFGNGKENQSNTLLVKCLISCLGYVVTIWIKMYWITK